MAPVFASPDIAALVAAFPPPLPTKDRPSLVRSHSGNDLLDSRKVLVRFRVLLETSAGRIKKSDLPSRLGIEKTDWLLDCYDGEVYYGKDLQTLIPAKETLGFVEQIRDETRNELVDVADFASKQDVARQSCDRLLASESDLRHFSPSDAKQVVCHIALLDHFKKEVSSAVASAVGDKVDLSSAIPSVPLSVLSILTKEVLEQGGKSGSVITESERVIYVPANYETLQAKRLEEVYKSEVKAALNDLEIDGYCATRNDVATRNSPTADGNRDLAADVMTLFQSKHGGVAITSFDQAGKGATSTSSVVAKVESVDKAMMELDEIMQNLARTKPLTDTVSLGSVEPTLRDEASYVGLTERLLASTEYRKSLEASLASARGAVEDERSQKFEDVCRESFLAPLELYSQGLKTVPDQTLNERLSKYVCEQFRSEVLPGLVKELQDAGLLRDKTRSKEMDKLNAVSTQTNTVADLQAAASKFGRKQKIAVPDSSQLTIVKRDNLREKLRSMQTASRGSDVLIHLIWILLAQERDGLFLSAGKDTSRMIKLYQSSGDTEKAQKLEHWRDLLKAGKQTDEDVRQMKAMAGEVIESMCGDDNANNEG